MRKKLISCDEKETRMHDEQWKEAQKEANKLDPYPFSARVIRLVILALGSVKQDNGRYIEMLRRYILPTKAWYDLYVGLGGTVTWGWDLLFLNRESVAKVEQKLSEQGRLRQWGSKNHRGKPRTLAKRRRYDTFNYKAIRRMCIEKIAANTKATLKDLIFIYARSWPGDEVRKAIEPRILEMAKWMLFDEIYALREHLYAQRKKLEPMREYPWNKRRENVVRGGDVTKKNQLMDKLFDDHLAKTAGTPHDFIRLWREKHWDHLPERMFKAMVEQMVPRRKPKKT